MNKKKSILLISLGLSFAVAISAVVVVDAVSNKKQTTTDTSNSAYNLYRLTHPDYTKTEEEWLQDLINGKLGDRTKYTVKFNSNSEESTVPEQVVLDGDKVVEPEDPTKLGYTFEGWTYKGEPWIFYGFSVSEDMTLDANWSLNHYNITYDLSGGDEEVANPSIYTVESEFEFNNPTKHGYEFVGWFDADNKKIDDISKGMTGDLALTAHWKANENELTLEPVDSTRGSAYLISGTGETDTSMTVGAISKDPYVFKGWYDKLGELVSKDIEYTFTMPGDDYYLEARFDELRKLNLTVSDESKGSVIGDGDYIIGDEVTIDCEIYDGIFMGWYDDKDNLISSFTEYTFTMPDKDTNYHAVFVKDEDEEEYSWEIAHGVIPSFSEDRQTVTYGMYPRTVVEDVDLINVLNTIQEHDENGYVEYLGDYYVNKITKIYDFARYYDTTGIDVPMNYDSGTKMIDGMYMWYKVEPIVWNVMRTEEGKYTLMSRDLIDYSKFSNLFSYNYENSYVRSVLNTSFYDKAFKLGDNYVIETVVDNSAASTGNPGNPHICDNTFDKVFLPSVMDVKNLPQDASNISKTTDFLRSSGVYYDFQTNIYFSDYWTRSADSDLEYNDHVKRITSVGRVGRCSANLYHCLRPCITIEYL